MTKILPSLCLLLLIAMPASALTVKRVVDGDTLVLSDGRRVRLIGVDTPEVHASAKLKRDAERTRHDARAIQQLGRRAEMFVKALIEGRSVRLEFDQHNKSHRNKDRYGRTLAYVYFEPPACDQLEQNIAEQVCELPSFEKGFLNAVIIEAGYANAYTKFPFKHHDEFLDFQREAREKKRGLWREEGPLTLSTRPSPRAAIPRGTPVRRAA